MTTLTQKVFEARARRLERSTHGSVDLSNHLPVFQKNTPLSASL